MARLLLSLLGPFGVRLSGEPVTQFESNKVRALLAYLATEAGRPHHRDVLAGLLWPEYPNRTARTYLRNALSNLRRAIGDREAASPVLLVNRLTIRFNPESDCWVDVQAFRALVQAASDHALEEAVALYRGEFMAGFALGDSPPFEEWLLVVREQLERQASGALELLALAARERGDYDRACAYARRRVALEPWNEDAHRQVMRALALSGHRSAALVQYESCRRLLAQELDALPDAETEQLVQQIREGKLADREEVYHPGTGAAAALTLPAAPRHNLPAQLTPLVGREQELAALEELLADESRRLITLSGPGGSGKTRLALAAAAQQVEHYRDGVYFVPLAGVSTVKAIAPSVAEALGVPLYGAQDPLQQLIAHLRAKEMLLVMDNYEHLLDGVEVVIAILRAAPRVQVLATSRGRLGVQSEQVFPVGGLALPAPGEVLPQMARRGAMQLFLSAARRVRPGFELDQENVSDVARVCRLMGGMPLGILLAAAWIEVLTAGQIAEQIESDLDLLTTDWRDVPARQRSIRAVLDHSWQFLSEREQEAMRAFSVFRGSFTWEAAREVAGVTLRDLRRLLDRALLQQSEAGRYQVHELLRQYAVEKLCTLSARDAALHGEQALTWGNECLALTGRYCLAEGEQYCAAVHDRHCAYYAQFLYAREDEVVRGYVGEVMREIDNVRAAWRWAARRGKAQEILQSSISLWVVHNSLGWVREGAETFGRAAESLRREAAEGSRETKEVALGLVLGIQSFFLRYLDRDEQAAPLVEESLALLRKHGPRRELALGLFYARFECIEDIKQHRQLMAELLALSQATDFYLGQVLALRALDRNEDALRISRAADDLRGMAFAFWHLGEEAYAHRAYAKANEHYEQSLASAQEAGIPWLVGCVWTYLGDVALAQGEPEKAREHYRQGLAQSEQIHHTLAVLRHHERLGRAALALDDPQAAAQHYCRALQMAAESHSDLLLRQDVLTLDLLLGLVEFLAPTELEKAVALAALARHHPASSGATMDRAQALLERLASELNPTAFAAAQDQGRGRDLQATAQELLAEIQESHVLGCTRFTDPRPHS